MSAKPRDLLKTRPQRVGEVLSNVHLKAGQANGQVIVWGCTLAVGTPTTGLDITAGEVTIGQALVALAASAANAVPAGAATAAGQFRKVLVERKADGTVVFVVGAIAAAQADAPLPKSPNADAISLGWIEVPASFTPGTTALTAGMLKPVLYSS